MHFSKESRGLEVRQAVSAHLNSYGLQGAHLVARPHLEHGLRESFEFHPMPPVSLSSTSIVEEKTVAEAERSYLLQVALADQPAAVFAGCLEPCEDKICSLGAFRIRNPG